MTTASLPRPLLLLLTVAACDTEPPPEPATPPCMRGLRIETVTFSATHPLNHCEEETQRTYEVDVCDWPGYFDGDLCSFTPSYFVDRETGHCLIYPATCGDYPDGVTDPVVTTCDDFYSPCCDIDIFFAECIEPPLED